MRIKKLLICFVYFLFAALSANAQENLYLIKGIPQENLSNIISNYYSLKGYNITNLNGFYISPPSNNNDYYEVLIEQNGLDCYLYYFTQNTNNENLLLIKEIQKGHFKIKTVEDPDMSYIFKNKAFSLKEDYEKKLNKSANYSFDEDAQEEFDKQHNIPNLPSKTQGEFVLGQYAQKPQKLTISTNHYTPIHNKNDNQLRSIEEKNVNSTKLLKGSIVTIASGSIINASLQSAISSASMSVSDRITAVLNNDFSYNGYVIFPKETILYGTALNAKASSYGYGNGSLDLTFNQALLPNGKKISLSIDKISYEKKSERAVNVTRDVAVGTGVGVLSGLVSAALTGNVSQALIVGASLGAAGGGLHAISKKGEEIEIHEGTILNLKLNQPINISPYN